MWEMAQATGSCSCCTAMNDIRWTSQRLPSDRLDASKMATIHTNLSLIDLPQD